MSTEQNYMPWSETEGYFGGNRTRKACQETCDELNSNRSDGDHNWEVAYVPFPERIRSSMKQSEWLWIGVTMHFIGAHHCGFRLATIIGDYVISTVGQYIPVPGEGVRQIGSGRTYETYVFKGWTACNNPGCECGMPVINDDALSEIDSDGYNTAEDAQEGHMKMCHKYSEKG